MMAFIFFILLVVFTLLAISFVIRSYALGMISALALMTIGVDILANDIAGINNILTLALGIICICMGAFIFLNGSLEKIQEIQTRGVGEW